jgi:F-type H+-transporting ATPase subunit epsilon
MAIAANISLRVVTPERQVITTEAQEVVIPAHDGELGVLPGRAPLMCELGIGQLRYSDGGTTRRVFIDGGFAQVLNDRVMVLTPRALQRDEVTDAIVTEAEHPPDAKQVDPDDQLRQRQRASALRRLQS